MAYTIPQIETYAELSQLEAEKDIITSSYLNGSRIDKRLPVMLYVERKGMSWMYEQNPTNIELFAVGQYVLALCGRYLFKALEISVGGGTVVNATSPVASFGFERKRIQFVVGEDGALISEGGDTISLSDNNIVYGSVAVHTDTGLLPVGLVDRPSYNVTYGTTGSSIVLAGFTAINGQVYIIEYDKPVADVTSGSSSSSRELPRFYRATGTEGNSISLDYLFGVTIGMVFRESQLQENISPTTPTAAGYISFDNNTVVGSTRTGTITWAFDLAPNELIAINIL